MPSSSKGALGAFTSSTSSVSSWISLQAPSSAYAGGPIGTVSAGTRDRTREQPGAAAAY